MSHYPAPGAPLAEQSTANGTQADDMQHSTAPNSADAPEEDDFDKFMRGVAGAAGASSFDFDELVSRELEPGEKADDAIDYEDIDDDDLADEEEVKVPTHAPLDGKVGAAGGETDQGWAAMEGIFGGEGVPQPGGDDLDDLFGDVPSSPPDGVKGDQAAGGLSDFLGGEGIPGVPAIPELPDMGTMDELETELFGADDEMDEETRRDYELQQALFAMSAAYGPDNPPAPPENREELLASLWPKFDPDKIPRFMELLPPKRHYFVGKQPLKPPKRIVPTKLNLELAQDQERAFRTGQVNKRTLDTEQSTTVVITPTQVPDAPGDLVDLDAGMDDDLPGGITMQDLQFICTDWDMKGPVEEEEEPVEEKPQPRPTSTDVGEDEDDWFIEDKPPTKKRKLGKDPSDYLAYSHIDIPFFDDPLEATAKIARTINIDMNDPHLLLDEREETMLSHPSSIRAANRGEGAGAFAKNLIKRYNISNDEAYDLLKENHQNKVRSTLGNVALEHSMPAVRLQWPYYKTKLARQEARSFHRPVLSFLPNMPNTFKKPAYIKRKHQRGKDAKTLFDSTKSLSLGDNSSVLLVEYSEECPPMMSNFGMGSRVVNYYRRKNNEDTTRPKAEIGETAVLLPQDKSPYSIFGHIDPGETSTAVTTGMFRAPIFHQEAKPTDFLVIRNTTGVDGSSYYMRPIENLYVAGQQFPSVDVPGPHSRKVTTAAKNRLKMICFRQLRKNKNHRIRVDSVTKHFPDTTDMQNRQKMKEFLQFSKDHKEWEMKSGEPIPDEDVLRGYIKPEDVCLLESMQVGQQQLHDAGYEDVEEIEDEGKEGKEAKEKEGEPRESLEQQLAPWKTTRNFILATQGKAMLKLHGDGDPTGRNEGYSFIKTSMKGGFKPVGESVKDKLDARRLKELGGHSYNVADQQRMYEEAIRKIWDNQKRTLSSNVEQSDEETDVDAESTDLLNRPRSRSERPTPSASFGRRDDETGSQFSKLSTNSQAGKILRITRRVRNSRGQIEVREEIVRDPMVIKQYRKERFEAELENMEGMEYVKTGNKELDDRREAHMLAELNRLKRNKERRHAREKQKGILPSDGDNNMSPSAATSPGPSGPAAAAAPKGTQRRCANCGQVGHIKTNKKLCPMLNGTMKPEDTASSGASAFAMGAPPAL